MPAVASVSVNKKPSLQTAAAAATNTNVASAANTNTNTNKEGGFKFLRRDEGRLSYSVPSLPETPSKTYNGISPRANANNTDKLAAECGTPPSSAVALNTGNKNNNNNISESNNVNNSGEARGNRERRTSRSLREIIAEDMKNAKNHDYLDEVVVVVPKKAPPSATDKDIIYNNNKTKTEKDNFNSMNNNKTDEMIRKEGSALRTGQGPIISTTTLSSSSLPPSPASRANINTRQTRQGNTRSNNNNNTKSTNAAARRNSISRRPVWVDPEIPSKQDNEGDNGDDHNSNKDYGQEEHLINYDNKNNNSNARMNQTDWSRTQNMYKSNITPPNNFNNYMVNQRSHYRDSEFDTVHNNANNMGNDAYHNNTNAPLDSNYYSSSDINVQNKLTQQHSINSDNSNALYGTDGYDMNDTMNSTPFSRNAMSSHVHPSLHPPRRTMSAPRRFTDFNSFDPQNQHNITTTITTIGNMNSTYSSVAATSPSLMPMANTNYFNRPRPRDFSVPAGRSRVLAQPTHVTDSLTSAKTNANVGAINGEEAELMLQLEREVRAAQHEREQYMNLLEELNSEKSRFEAYKFEMQQQWDEERAALEQTRQLGEHAAQKEVKLMNERYRSVSSLLSNERSTNARLMHENESLRSQLEELTSTLRESQMMHKTEVARLRRDIDSLTRRNAELLDMTKEQQLRLLESSDTNKNQTGNRRSNSRGDNMNSVSTSYSRNITNNDNNDNNDKINERNAENVKSEEKLINELEVTENRVDTIPSANVNTANTTTTATIVVAADKIPVKGNVRNRVTSQTNELISSTMTPENKTRNVKRSASTIPASVANRHNPNEHNAQLLNSTRGRLSESQPSLHSAAIRAHSTSRIFSNRPTNTSTSALPGSVTNASEANININALTSNMAVSIPVLHLPGSNNNINNKDKEESIATEHDKLKNENANSLNSGNIKNSAEKKKVINLSPLHTSQVESAELDVVDPTSVVLDFTPRKNDEAQRERKAREMAAHLQREEDERQQRRLQRERQAQERNKEEKQQQPTNSNNLRNKLEEREHNNSQESTSHASRQAKSKAINATPSPTSTKITTTTTTTGVGSEEKTNNNNNKNSKNSNTNSSLVIPRNPKLGQAANSVPKSSSTLTPQSQRIREKSTNTAQGTDLISKTDADNKVNNTSNNDNNKNNVKATSAEKELAESGNSSHLNNESTNNKINNEIEKSDKSKDEVEEQGNAAFNKHNEDSDNDDSINEDDNEDNITNKEDNLNATQRPPREPRVQHIPTCAELIGEVEPEPQENVVNDTIISQNTLGNNANKREELYNSGKRVIYYSNGTIKTILPSGHTVLRFVNKDVKTTFPSGTSTYWYEAAQTRHTQRVNGVQIFEFHATGQTERHLPNGTKEILYPDGSFKIVYADGTDETLVPDSDEEVSSSAQSQE